MKRTEAERLRSDTRALARMRARVSRAREVAAGERLRVLEEARELLAVAWLDRRERRRCFDCGELVWTE